MESKYQSSHCIELPPALAAAIVAAQAAGESLRRDSTGDKGKYTTADEIAFVARKALTDHGAAWVRLDVTLEAPALAQADIGKQAYVGDLVERWAIVHKDGGALLGSSRMPVITSMGRPHDKAVGASLTYDVGGALRGALCMDREDKNAIDRRADDEHHEPEPPAPKRPAKTAAKPTSDLLGPRCSGKAAGLGKAIDERMQVLHKMRKVKLADAWADVLAEAGIETAKYGDGALPPAALTVADGEVVRTYLVNMLGTAAGETPEQPKLDAAGLGKLRAECQKLYNRLCDCAPDDFAQGVWKAEWSRMADLDEWPDQPTEQHYRNVRAGLTQAVRSVEA